MMMLTTVCDLWSIYRPESVVRARRPTVCGLVFLAVILCMTTPTQGRAEAVRAGRDLQPPFDADLGRAIFDRPWFPAPGSTKSTDGLGPLYNARSCQGCHIVDGPGRPTETDGPSVRAVSRVVRLGVPTGDRAARPDRIYGVQIQDFGVAGVSDEGRPQVTWIEEPVALDDGTVVRLRRPVWSIAALQYGPLEAATTISPRTAPRMVGLGLLEAVPAERVRAFADPADADGDGVSGVAAEVEDRATGAWTLGRFGWKASQPNLRQQAASAFSADMGLSTSLFPSGHGDCTAAQQACRSAPVGAGPGRWEVSDTMLELVTVYTRYLTAPARRQPATPAERRGRALFQSVGRDACHRPSLATAERGVDPALAGRTFWPFTDLLLHDMGDGLADGLAEGSATGREWRTAPLWGIGSMQLDGANATLLHDGRARSILEAILWHGGEAQAARDRVAGLDGADRDALIAYVRSL
jgi:CxxC motif-containing protein (DUF1111 family)